MQVAEAYDFSLGEAARLVKQGVQAGALYGTESFIFRADFDKRMNQMQEEAARSLLNIFRLAPRAVLLREVGWPLRFNLARK